MKRRRARPGERSGPQMCGERYKHRPQGLSARQCGYVLNLANGMSRRGAALAAGYSPRSAENVAHAVEGKRRGRFSMMRRFVQLLTAQPA